MAKKDNYDLYGIIKAKNEDKIKELVIRMLNSVINKDEDKNELSYFPGTLIVSIPLELGWKDNYQIKDKWLDKALDIIANFEGDTEEEAVNKSKQLLNEFKKGRG
ncbi:hypothetical protein HZB01_01980 [Candidatus Woesearchaeota archaeon]|nr:hypothetical protein [Candidatus Woesearchaeota archaeon]